MPNIADLMGVPQPAAGDDEFAPTEIDGDKLLSAFDELIAGHAERMGVMNLPQDAHIPAESGTESGEAVPGGEEVPAPDADSAPVEAPASPPQDVLDGSVDEPPPVAEIPPIAAAPAPVPPPPVEASQIPLPEEFLEGTSEAVLYRQQAEILANQRADAEYRQAVAEHQARTSAQQTAFASVTEAGNRFAARYAGRLEPADMMTLARKAGSEGLAGVLASTIATRNGRAEPTASDFQQATEEALEITLLRDETLRAKVLSPIAPAPQTPGSTRTDADRERQSKATALATPASPAAPAPQRPPLAVGGNGKFTPQSRQQMIEDAAKMIRSSQQGGF